MTIYFHTVDGTGPTGAVAPGDYIAQANGQLVIPDGYSSGTIFVSTNTDAFVEPTETMSILLTATTSGTLRTVTGTGSIIDGTAQPPSSADKRLKARK